MKKFLLQCDSLESDKEVLEHAFELFGAPASHVFLFVCMLCCCFSASHAVKTMDHEGQGPLPDPFKGSPGWEKDCLA